MTREQFIDQVKMIAKEEGFTVMGTISDLPQTNLIRITLSDGAGYFDITVDMDGNNDLTFNTLRHALQNKGRINYSILGSGSPYQERYFQLSRNNRTLGRWNKNRGESWRS